MGVRYYRDIIPVNSFFSATHEGYDNPVLDAAIDIVPNLLAVGSTIKSAQSVPLTISSIKDAIVNIGAKSFTPANDSKN